MDSTAALGDRVRDFALASTLASYPDEEVESTLRALGPALDRERAAAGFMRALSAEGGFDDLRSTYVGLFDRGEGRIPLYETEWGRMRGMSKGRDLADISGFYRAFGLEIDAPEMLDHIAVELEFYAVLLAKEEYLAAMGNEEGRSIVEDARRKFLIDHLGPLASAVAARLAGQDQPAYGEALAWCGEIVDRECQALGATPAPLDPFADPDGEREMKCGGVHLPVVA